METKKNSLKKGFLGCVASFLLIFFDQITKMWAVNGLRQKEPYVLINGIFELQYLENRGAAFGILQGKKMFFILFTVVVLVFLVYLFLKKIPAEKKFIWLDIICILFFSGAIGNFIDRVRQDYVVDFFSFCLIDFPIFNVADIYVTVAAFAMIFLGLFYYKDEDYEKIFPAKTAE